MDQIAIFYEYDRYKIESEVNEWIEDAKVKNVVDIKFFPAKDGNPFICVVHYKSDCI